MHGLSITILNVPIGAIETWEKDPLKPLIFTFKVQDMKVSCTHLRWKDLAKQTSHKALNDPKFAIKHSDIFYIGIVLPYSSFYFINLTSCSTDLYISSVWDYIRKDYIDFMTLVGILSNSHICHKSWTDRGEIYGLLT
jgi:hypothetical protein